MKRISTLFLQIVILLIGLVTTAFLIWFPQTEGRATNLDLFSIYADPLILYVYASSIAFYIALYKAFQLLRYISQNKVFSTAAVGTLKSIKICAIVLAALIASAGLYITWFHHQDDDPVGFLVVCMVAAFASIVIATAAAIFQKLLQRAVDMKSENDLTI